MSDTDRLEELYPVNDRICQRLKNALAPYEETLRKENDGPAKTLFVQVQNEQDILGEGYPYYLKAKRILQYRIEQLKRRRKKITDKHSAAELEKTGFF